MCGIFGAITDRTLTNTQASFIKAATLVGQLRGEDGTGWIIQSHKAKPKVYKRALCGNDFLDTRIGRKATKQLLGAQVVIGHNRKTTSGGDNDYECHPYMYDNLVGVHNGGIPDAVLNRLETKDTIADVDSAKLYASLNATDNPLSVLKKIHMGTYALVWIDKRTNEVCMARNGDRPLWASSSKDGMYFASEPGMLFWLMSRYGLQNKDSKLLELKEEHLYRIPLDDPAKIRRTKYTATPPVYPARTGYVSKPTNKSWYNNKPAPQFVRWATSISTLRTEYPALSYIADILEENVDEVNKAYDVEVDNPRRFDVYVTDVQARGTNISFPNVSGYVADVTDSGIIIPVTMPAVKDEGFDFIKRFARAQKSSTLLSYRAKMSSIKVQADGTVIIFVQPITVWDDNNNIPKNAATSLACAEVVDQMNPPPATPMPAILLEMWNKLTTKVVH